MLWLQSSLLLMHRRPADVLVLQQGQHFRVAERIAPASDDRQQSSVGAEPFQRPSKARGRSAL